MCWHVHGEGWGAAPIRCEQDGATISHRDNPYKLAQYLIITVSSDANRGSVCIYRHLVHGRLCRIRARLLTHRYEVVAFRATHIRERRGTSHYSPTPIKLKPKVALLSFARRVPVAGGLVDGVKEGLKLYLLKCILLHEKSGDVFGILHRGFGGVEGRCPKSFL